MTINFLILKASKLNKSFQNFKFSTSQMESGAQLTNALTKISLGILGHCIPLLAVKTLSADIMKELCHQRIICLQKIYVTFQHSRSW